VPAKSKAQRIVMAIAEHHPEELYDRNKGAADMTHEQLHDFAATPAKHLPTHVHASYKMAREARKKNGE